MRSRWCAPAVLFVAVSLDCNRYEWKPDNLVPEVCPRTRPAATRVRVDSQITAVAGAIQGRVIRAETTAPIFQANVELDRNIASRGHTDSDGYFRLDSVTAGRHMMRIFGIGYNTWQDTVNVGTEARPPFVIALTPAVTDGPCSGFAAVRVRKPWWKIW